MLTGKFHSVLPCIVIRGKFIETWLGVLPRLDREDAQSLAYDIFDKMTSDLPSPGNPPSYAEPLYLNLVYLTQIHDGIVDHIPGAFAEQLRVRAFVGLFAGAVPCASPRSEGAELEYTRRLHAASQRLADNLQCVDFYNSRGKAFVNAYIEGRKLRTLGRRPLQEAVDYAYPVPDCRCADCESALRTFLPHPIKDGFTHLGTSTVHKHLIEVAARSGRINARVTKAGVKTRLSTTKAVCLLFVALTRATDCI